MKFFAFFLPQFHEIPENNEWWGNGFTEWSNVKKAKPLFKGHMQPVVPLNNNYYNLLEKETVEWQTKLMKEYGIEGMVYYHYYFKGKKLLEKPAENLLKWKDIDQKFFFCWANHSWRRTWEGKQTILIEQTYGTREDWEIHFQYLLQFFLDERYEKIDNCPILMLFRPAFEEKTEMMHYFDMRSKEEGFNGIYLIEQWIYNYLSVEEMIQNKPVEKYGVIFREPEYSKIKYYEYQERNLLALYSHAICNRVKRLFKIGQYPMTYFEGNKLFKAKIRNYSKQENIWRSICLSWDNTVRHQNRGYIIESVSKDVLFEYLDLIKEEPYCMINAWNEWAEGMVLEPSEQNGYQYLKWIKEWRERSGQN